MELHTTIVLMTIAIVILSARVLLDYFLIYLNEREARLFKSECIELRERIKELEKATLNENNQVSKENQISKSQT